MPSLTSLGFRSSNDLNEKTIYKKKTNNCHKMRHECNAFCNVAMLDKDNYSPGPTRVIRGGQ